MAIRFPQRPDGVQKKKPGVQNREFNETKVIEVPVYYPGDDEITWIKLDQVITWEGRTLYVFGKIEVTKIERLRNFILFFDMGDYGMEDDAVFLIINSYDGSERHVISLYDTMQATSLDVHTILVGVAASAASLILAGGTISKRVAFPHARVMLYKARVMNHKPKPPMVMIHKPNPNRRHKPLIWKPKPLISKPKPLISKPKSLIWKSKRLKPKPWKPLEPKPLPNPWKPLEPKPLPNPWKPLKPKPRGARLYAYPDMMCVEAEKMFQFRNKIVEIYAQNTKQSVQRIQQDLERGDHSMSATEAKAYGIVDDVIMNKPLYLF